MRFEISLLIEESTIPFRVVNTNLIVEETSNGYTASALFDVFKGKGETPQDALLDYLRQALEGIRAFHGEDKPVREYTDESTGVQLIVEKDNPDYPGYPKLTIVCPKQISSIDVINDAVARLQNMAAIAPQHRIPPIRIDRR